MNTLVADLRFAIRLLGRNPMLTLVAALSLGLGAAGRQVDRERRDGNQHDR